MVTSDNSLEGIARNNLKMAESDEVLIIINKKVAKPKKKKRQFDFEQWFKPKQNTNQQGVNEIPYIPQTVDEE